MINLAGNNVKEPGMKCIVKLALVENQSLLNFDVRLNPGATDKVRRQVALCMLKNVEQVRAKGTQTKKDWFCPEVYSFQMQPTLLKGLGLKVLGEVRSRSRVA